MGNNIENLSLESECPLKDTLKLGHKVSYHWTKAKVIDIDDNWIKIKFDSSWLTQDVSNEQINNLEIRVLNKNNKEAQRIVSEINERLRHEEFEKKFEEIREEASWKVNDILNS